MTGEPTFYWSGCHLSTVAAELVEDDRQTLECVTLAGLHVDPRGEWFELRELRFKRRKIRGIALDEQEIEFGGVQQLLAVDAPPLFYLKRMGRNARIVLSCRQSRRNVGTQEVLSASADQKVGPANADQRVRSASGDQQAIVDRGDRGD